MSNPQTAPTTSTDTGSFGWAVLGFFVPLAGLILWLVWRDTKPNNSRQSRNGFIAGVVVQVIMWIIYSMMMASYVASMR